MGKKILIIEDEIIIAEDMKIILETEGYSICGIADNYDSAIHEFKLNSPDIIITDIYLKGDKTGIDIALAINKIKQLPFIFITAYSSDELIDSLATFHNITYLTKPFTNSQVIAAVAMMSVRIDKSKHLPKISKREQQVLDLMIEGRSSKEIAEELEISFDTVRSHRKKLFVKYKVTSAGELVNLALKTNHFKL
jgi:DNA-binding NarL/FixJ family response regulator